MILLGLDFADIGLEAAAARVRARAGAPGFAYVVTPNADHFARLGRAPALAPLYRTSFLRLFDSRCLALAARALGLAAPPVVTGADLTAHLLARAEGRIAILGMETAEIARLRARYPRLAISHMPLPMGLTPADEAFAAAVLFVAAARAPLVFIALGAPLQEILASAVAAHPASQGVGLCIGAALGFCAGTRRRAPPAWRRLGLEWLHRLIKEPRRLALRYLVRDPPVLLRLLCEALR